MTKQKNSVEESKLILTVAKAIQDDYDRLRKTERLQLRSEICDEIILYEETFREQTGFYYIPYQNRNI